MSAEFMLDMLGDRLKTALVEARGRTGDSSIMARIGAVPGGGEPPPGFVPGLVSVERDGHDPVFGLSEDDAVAHLEALA